MKHLVVNPHNSRIIFFDLEFYVPESGRERKGFCYNPWDKSCKFLGGSFFVAKPQYDLSKEVVPGDNRLQSIWLWKHDSEKELVLVIFQLFKQVLDIVLEKGGGKISPILCGIGITSSDVPIIFELFKRYHILSNSEAFYFQNKFRVLDISQLAIATFNTNSSFIYPKQKQLILDKFMPGKKFDSGKSVWDLYDAKEYFSIESRVKDEVSCAHLSYIKILNDYRKFKELEKSDRKLRKRPVTMSHLDTQTPFG